MARRKRRTVAERGPHPVDVHVGSRVHSRRTLLSMSMKRLGEALGVTYQQLQMYERGANRIGASRLYQLCRILDVPVGYFFAGLEEEVSSSPPDDSMHKRETLELVKAYYRVRDPKVRNALRGMTLAMAKGASGG